MKEIQNTVLCDSKDNQEDAGQVPDVKSDGNGFGASRFDCSESVDVLENHKEDEIKNFVSPYTISSEKLEALEKESDYYMDKSIMECEVPELIVCYKEGSCNTIKDICIDEGVPSPDNIWFETGVDEKACFTFSSPDEDQNRLRLDEQMDIVMTLSEAFKSSAQNDLDKDFDIPCDSKDLMQRGDKSCGASEKTATDASKDIFSSADGLSIQELGTGNIHSKSSNEDSNGFMEKGTSTLMQRVDTTYNASEKTAIDASKDIFSAADGISIQELGTGNIHPKSSNEDGNDVLEKGTSTLMQRVDPTYNASEKTAIDASKDIFSPANGLSMQEAGAVTVHSKSSKRDSNEAARETVQIFSEKGSEGTALVSATEESNDCEKEVLVSPAEESNCLVDELSDTGKVENRSVTFGLDSLVPVSFTRDGPQDGVLEHFETQNMPVDVDRDDDTDTSDSEIVPGQAQQCLAAVITGGEKCPENGVCQCPKTSNTCMADDDISNSKIVSSQAPHLAPVTIAREECPDTAVCRCPETSNTSMLEDTNSDTQNASFHVQHGLGESSFSAVSHFSSLLNTSGPYSGNVSLRSESSTTSTRSFAFPVLQSEWNSSPVRMAKADRRHLRKHGGWRHSLLCCRF